MHTDKNRPLERLFNSITLNYDRMNKILTLGMDRRWRRYAAEAVAHVVTGGEERSPEDNCLSAGDRFAAGAGGPAESPAAPGVPDADASQAAVHSGVPTAAPPAAVLDLCTGTGDLAYLLAKILGSRARVTGLDHSPQMLARAEEKRFGNPGNPENPENPRFLMGDAAALPWPEASFDAVAVSFAFRNLTYRNPRSEKTIAEIRQVLQPGGALVIVESSQPDSRLIKFLRDIYVELMAGKLVARLSGHGPAYRYLADSMKKYYGPSEMQKLLQAAGFTSVRYTPLLFGAAGLYLAS